MVFIEIIFLIVASAFMVLSKNIVIKIISGVLILAYAVVSKLLNYFKRKKIINNINERIYMSCKENKYVLFLIAFSFLINSVTELARIVNYKTTEIFINNEKEINGIIDFFSRINIDEKVNIFVNIIPLVLAFLFIIDGLMSFAVISDDKVIFHNASIVNFSEITEVKYRKPLFSNKKIVILRNNNYDREIILKLEDLEKLKKHLENKIAL